MGAVALGCCVLCYAQKDKTHNVYAFLLFSMTESENELKKGLYPGPCQRDIYTHKSLYFKFKLLK